MKTAPISKIMVACFALAFVVPSVAIPQTGSEDENFDSENAILDTSVLFAIGAQEAYQSLRGSFGWPTFQEGLVEGVYFRFDPDGYARFSPVPRLDVDVFEVICRPRTYNCLARKGDLNVFLNARRQLQLRIEGIAEGDRFFLAEGVTEIELPESILQPLDNRFEALLLAGGELIVRRSGEEFERVSLVGFSAASTYLRWIAARQDYSILPRGWPVPNSRVDTAGNVTQPTTWSSPMPKPQRIRGVSLGESPRSVQAINQLENTNQPSELAAVKTELSELRNLLKNELGDNPVAAMSRSPAVVEALNSPQLNAPLGVEGALIERVSRLEESLQSLEPANRVDISTTWMPAPDNRNLGLEMGKTRDIELSIEDTTQLRRLLLERFGMSEEKVEEIVDFALNHQQQQDNLFDIFESVPALVSSNDGEITREDDVFRTREVDQILADLEQQFTLPIESNLSAAPNATEIRDEPTKTLEIGEYLTFAAFFKSLAM